MDHGAKESGETVLRTLASKEELSIFSLVLSAARIDHRIHFINDSQIEILVAAKLLERAEYELFCYEEENKNWPPVQPQDNYRPGFRAMAFLVIAYLGYIYEKSGNWQEKSHWFLAGAGDSSAILENLELYRLITALTLHGDLVHLLSNCVLGGVLLHYYFLMVGNGLGLVAILMTATLANFINVLGHGPGHHFVGFSTAVFSVIGMLSVLGSSARKGSALRLLPVMAGLALLAMLGSGGERTDFGGHFFGLLVGFAGGFILKQRAFKHMREKKSLQLALILISVVTVAGAWHLAFGG